jgi:hypothetical protein
MSHIITFDENSRCPRVFIQDSTSTTGAGKTGLTFETSGLIISTIASNEASATVYTVAATHVETISTLGTYAAPSASCCRFKEVDATNHPGLYELQFADARYSVSGAKDLIVTITGTGIVPTHLHIPLPAFDLYTAVPGVNLRQILGTELTETAGYLAAGFKKFFNVETPVLTAESVNQTGDSYAKLDTELQTIDDNVDAIKAKTDMQPTVWYSA